MSEKLTVKEKCWVVADWEDRVSLRDAKWIKRHVDLFHDPPANFPTEAEAWEFIVKRAYNYADQAETAFQKAQRRVQKCVKKRALLARGAK